MEWLDIDEGLAALQGHDDVSYLATLPEEEE